MDENNCIIWRDTLLPIPEDSDLKVDVKDSPFQNLGSRPACFKLYFPHSQNGGLDINQYFLLFSQVGRITCPLLLVVGQDDTNWAAVESADDVSNVPVNIECVLM